MESKLLAKTPVAASANSVAALIISYFINFAAEWKYEFNNFIIFSKMDEPCL